MESVLCSDPDEMPVWLKAMILEDSNNTQVVNSKTIKEKAG